MGLARAFTPRFSDGVAARTWSRTKTFETVRLKLSQLPHNLISYTLSRNFTIDSASTIIRKRKNPNTIFYRAIISVFTLHAEFHSCSTMGNGSLGNTYKNLIKELSVRINKADRLSLPNGQKKARLNYHWWVVLCFFFVFKLSGLCGLRCKFIPTESKNPVTDNRKSKTHWFRINHV